MRQCRFRRPRWSSRAACIVLGLVASAGSLAAQRGAAPFTLRQVTGYPFPSALVAAPSGARVAWVFDERGVRNIYEAAAPDWQAHRVTSYTADDGQELTNLSFTPDGNTIVYVRGGDHDANWSAPGNLAPDPASSPVQPIIEIWSVPASGGQPKKLAEGDLPIVSPHGDRIAYIRDHQIWTVPVDGSQPGTRLIFATGESESPAWSPDGSMLAFVSSRGDHSFIALFTNDSTPLRYVSPSTSFDDDPRWSPDGSQIAFTRRPGGGGAPQTMLQLHPRPFSIWAANVSTLASHQVWQSPNTLRGSEPTTDGGANLNWAAGNRIVFLADLDGWPHLYSVSSSGGEPLLLTPAHGMAEYITMSHDGKTLAFAANMGTGTDDLERRHIFTVPVDRATPVDLTPGVGIEWTPVITADGASVVYLSADAKRPPIPAIIPLGGGASRLIAADRIPSDFPTSQLIVPRAVTYRASDGIEVHADLFAKPGLTHAPAVVFVHGGPPRQMMLCWHYMDYYSNSYAVNQYLASRGYVVLAVNYRLGIGYGHEFHHPEHAGRWGASEYLDVKAGAEYLRTLPEVNAGRIGIWGGSYGGFLTAMALAKNSDLFAAGVDMHGVHDWMTDEQEFFERRSAQYEKSDLDSAAKVAWQSSPVAYMSSWKSPVLLVQGDDDRNVHFHQTVDLARRLDAKGVKYEELVLPDEIHGFLRYASWMLADSATAAYLDKSLK
ncbi:MAG: S9 family peptidase [Gemmatimonadaceae bacterium]